VCFGDSVSRPSYKEDDELIALFKEPKNSKVRSLTFAGVLGQRGLPNLSNFKHLPVLELKDIKAFKIHRSILHWTFVSAEILGT
jgi:hypothetical protein